MILSKYQVSPKGNIFSIHGNYLKYITKIGFTKVKHSINNGTDIIVPVKSHYLTIKELRGLRYIRLDFI